MKREKIHQSLRLVKLQWTEVEWEEKENGHLIETDYILSWFTSLSLYRKRRQMSITQCRVETWERDESFRFFFLFYYSVSLTTSGGKWEPYIRQQCDCESLLIRDRQEAEKRNFLMFPLSFSSLLRHRAYDVLPLIFRFTWCFLFLPLTRDLLFFFFFRKKERKRKTTAVIR